MSPSGETADSRRSSVRKITGSWSRFVVAYLIVGAIGPGARRASRTVLPAGPTWGGPGRRITGTACRLAGQQPVADQLGQRLGVRDVGDVADRGHDYTFGTRQRRFQLLEIAKRHNPVVPSLNQQDCRVDSCQAGPQ